MSDRWLSETEDGGIVAITPEEAAQATLDPPPLFPARKSDSGS